MTWCMSMMIVVLQAKTGLSLADTKEASPGNHQVRKMLMAIMPEIRESNPGHPVGRESANAALTVQIEIQKVMGKMTEGETIGKTNM